MKHHAKTYNTNDCSLIEEAPNLASAVVRLHKMGQRTSVEVLNTIWKIKTTLIIGWMQGTVNCNPTMLREHLARAGIGFSYKESRNLFSFIKRLLNVLQKTTNLL